MAVKGKKVLGLIKLQILAGAANPSPPIGPALGQRGLNIMEFCKQFNAATKDLDKTLKVPVVITAYVDKTFDFVYKSPPASALLLKIAGLKSGSSVPNKNKVGKVTMTQVREIAKTKLADTNAASIETAMKSIVGTARSMGLDVIDDSKRGA